jgi:hypothetical protein
MDIGSKVGSKWVIYKDEEFISCQWNDRWGILINIQFLRQGNGTDEDQCYARNYMFVRCPRGRYFHLSCVGLNDENMPDSFFCSEKCRDKAAEENQNYPYCHNDLGANVAMIGCSTGAACKTLSGTFVCRGMDPKKPPSRELVLLRTMQGRIQSFKDEEERQQVW